MPKENKKKILILGASSDIGIEVVKIFIKKNWEIYAHCNSNNKKLNNLHNKNVKIIKINFLGLSDKALVGKIKKLESLKCDAFLNLIGYIDNKSFKSFNLKNVYTSLKVNSLIPFLIIQKIIKSMIKNRWGRIVQTSSIGVKFGGGKYTFNYSLSKKLNEFIPSDYKEWAKKNILINVLKIGVTNTKIHNKIHKKNIRKRINLIPINRMAEPIEIANTIEFLLSEKNTYITGETITISGGE